MAQTTESDYYEEFKLEHVKNQPTYEHHGRCSKCLYWQPLGHGFPPGSEQSGADQSPEKGECRLNAPGVVEFEVHWPVTHDYDWCGQFKAKAGAAGLAAM